eukprot:11409587-Heterocapsa_arctica.AAC.1
MYQHNIDQKVDRDRQIAKAEEEREKKRTNKVVTHEDIQIESIDVQQEVAQQNKKPRTEEPMNQQVTNISLLTMLHKRTADQVHYRTMQSVKKVKADKKTEQ